MAKKKSAPVSKSRPVAKKKATPRKPSASKKTPAKSKKPTASSVDGILKTFDKERVAQNSTLASTRKKIEQLTKQANSIKTNLEELKKKAVETEIAIETLDSRRDAEIGSLLSGMGIDLNKAAAAAAKPKVPVEKSTPLFDGQPESKNDEKNDGDEAKRTKTN